MNRIRTAVDTLGEILVIWVALLLCCAGLFMAIEGKTFVEALYWANTTATGTGYGDITPQTTAGRFLAIALQDLSILCTLPLLVVRYMERMLDNRDAFTHEEQLAMDSKLDEILERLNS